jgi:hypothetical protein
LLLPDKTRADVTERPKLSRAPSSLPWNIAASRAVPTNNMAAPASAYKDRQFLAVIGDEVPLTLPNNRGFVANAWQDTVTGMLLAGVGVSL